MEERLRPVVLRTSQDIARRTLLDDEAVIDELPFLSSQPDLPIHSPSITSGSIVVNLVHSAAAPAADSSNSGTNS